MDKKKKKTVKAPVNDALVEFAELYKTIKTTIVSKETGERIWALWQKYTGRTDRWRGCAGCLIAKVKFLKKRCIESGIMLKDGEQNSKKNTIPGEASGDVPGEQQ